MSSSGIDFESIVNGANDVVMVAEIGLADSGFRIVYVNDAFTRLSGYPADKVVGQSPRMLQGPETCLDTVEEISAVIHRGGSIRRRLLGWSAVLGRAQHRAVARP
jgi:PAS domain S-box-containing protein